MDSKRRSDRTIDDIKCKYMSSLRKHQKVKMPSGRPNRAVYLKMFQRLMMPMVALEQITTKSQPTSESTPDHSPKTDVQRNTSLNVYHEDAQRTSTAQSYNRPPHISLHIKSATPIKSPKRPQQNANGPKPAEATTAAKSLYYNIHSTPPRIDSDLYDFAEDSCENAENRIHSNINTIRQTCSSGRMFGLPKPLSFKHKTNCSFGGRVVKSRSIDQRRNSAKQLKAKTSSGASNTYNKIYKFLKTMPHKHLQARLVSPTKLKGAHIKTKPKVELPVTTGHTVKKQLKLRPSVKCIQRTPSNVEMSEKRECKSLDLVTNTDIDHGHSPSQTPLSEAVENGQHNEGPLSSAASDNVNQHASEHFGEVNTVNVKPHIDSTDMTPDPFNVTRTEQPGDCEEHSCATNQHPFQDADAQADLHTITNGYQHNKNESSANNSSNDIGSPMPHFPHLRSPNREHIPYVQNDISNDKCGIHESVQSVSSLFESTSGDSDMQENPVTTVTSPEENIDKIISNTDVASDYDEVDHLCEITVTNDVSLSPSVECRTSSQNVEMSDVSKNETSCVMEHEMHSGMSSSFDTNQCNECTNGDVSAANTASVAVSGEKHETESCETANGDLHTTNIPEYSVPLDTAKHDRHLSVDMGTSKENDKSDQLQVDQCENSARQLTGTSRTDECLYTDTDTNVSEETTRYKSNKETDHISNNELNDKSINSIPPISQNNVNERMDITQLTVKVDKQELPATICTTEFTEDTKCPLKDDCQLPDSTNVCETQNKLDTKRKTALEIVQDIVNEHVQSPSTKSQNLEVGSGNDYITNNTSGESHANVLDQLVPVKHNYQLSIAKALKVARQRIGESASHHERADKESSKLVEDVKTVLESIINQICLDCTSVCDSHSDSLHVATSSSDHHTNPSSPDVPETENTEMKIHSNLEVSSGAIVPTKVIAGEKTSIALSGDMPCDLRHDFPGDDNLYPNPVSTLDTDVCRGAEQHEIGEAISEQQNSEYDPLLNEVTENKLETNRGSLDDTMSTTVQASQGATEVKVASALLLDNQSDLLPDNNVDSNIQESRPTVTSNLVPMADAESSADEISSESKAVAIPKSPQDNSLKDDCLDQSDGFLEHPSRNSEYPKQVKINEDMHVTNDQVLPLEPHLSFDVITNDLVNYRSTDLLSPSVTRPNSSSNDDYFEIRSDVRDLLTEMSLNVEAVTNCTLDTVDEIPSILPCQPKECEVDNGDFYPGINDTTGNSPIEDSPEKGTISDSGTRISSTTELKITDKGHDSNDQSDNEPPTMAVSSSDSADSSSLKAQVDGGDALNHSHPPSSVEQSSRPPPDCVYQEPIGDSSGRNLNNEEEKVDCILLKEQPKISTQSISRNSTPEHVGHNIITDVDVHQHDIESVENLLCPTVLVNSEQDDDNISDTASSCGLQIDETEQFVDDATPSKIPKYSNILKKNMDHDIQVCAGSKRTFLRRRQRKNKRGKFKLSMPPKRRTAKKTTDPVVRKVPKLRLVSTDSDLTTNNKSPDTVSPSHEKTFVIKPLENLNPDKKKTTKRKVKEPINHVEEEELPDGKRKLYPRRDCIVYTSDIPSPTNQVHKDPASQSDNKQKRKRRRPSAAAATDESTSGQRANVTSTPPPNETGTGITDDRLSMEFSNHNWMIEKYKTVLQTSGTNDDCQTVAPAPVSKRVAKKSTRPHMSKKKEINAKNKAKRSKCSVKAASIFEKLDPSGQHDAGSHEEGGNMVPTNLVANVESPDVVDNYLQTDVGTVVEEKTDTNTPDDESGSGDLKILEVVSLAGFIQDDRKGESEVPTDDKSNSPGTEDEHLKNANVTSCKEEIQPVSLWRPGVTSDNTSPQRIDENIQVEDLSTKNVKYEDDIPKPLDLSVKSETNQALDLSMKPKSVDCKQEVKVSEAAYNCFNISLSTTCDIPPGCPSEIPKLEASSDEIRSRTKVGFPISISAPPRENLHQSELTLHNANANQNTRSQSAHSLPSGIASGVKTDTAIVQNIPLLHNSLPHKSDHTESMRPVPVVNVEAKTSHDSSPNVPANNSSVTSGFSVVKPSGNTPSQSPLQHTPVSHNISQFANTRCELAERNMVTPPDRIIATRLPTSSGSHPPRKPSPISHQPPPRSVPLPQQAASNTPISPVFMPQFLVRAAMQPNGLPAPPALHIAVSSNGGSLPGRNDQVLVSPGPASSGLNTLTNVRPNSPVRASFIAASNACRDASQGKEIMNVSKMPMVVNPEKVANTVVMPIPWKSQSFVSTPTTAGPSTVHRPQVQRFPQHVNMQAVPVTISHVNNSGPSEQHPISSQPLMMRPQILATHAPSSMKSQPHVISHPASSNSNVIAQPIRPVQHRAAETLTPGSTAPMFPFPIPPNASTQNIGLPGRNRESHNIRQPVPIPSSNVSPFSIGRDGSRALHSASNSKLHTARQRFPQGSHAVRVQQNVQLPGPSKKIPPPYPGTAPSSAAVSVHTKDGPITMPMAHINCEACSRRANFLCSGCKRVAYCSPECQLMAWKTHKNRCYR